jgi:hypothetical protein
MGSVQETSVPREAITKERSLNFTDVQPYKPSGFKIEQRAFDENPRLKVSCSRTYPL